jgi:hypothetical protein
MDLCATSGKYALWCRMYAAVGACVVMQGFMAVCAFMETQGAHVAATKNVYGCTDGMCGQDVLCGRYWVCTHPVTPLQHILPMWQLQGCNPFRALLVCCTGLEEAAVCRSISD